MMSKNNIATRKTQHVLSVYDSLNFTVWSIACVWIHPPPSPVSNLACILAETSVITNEVHPHARFTNPASDNLTGNEKNRLISPEWRSDKRHRNTIPIKLSNKLQISRSYLKSCERFEKRHYY
jgi:hypothetical protein